MDLAVDGKLLVDMTGPFPRRPEEQERATERLRYVLSGRNAFAFVLHNTGSLNSTDLGAFIGMLRGAGVECGGLGVGPIVRVVTSDERLRSLTNVVDSMFVAYATEDEALEDVLSPRHASGYVGLVILVGAALIVCGLIAYQCVG